MALGVTLAESRAFCQKLLAMQVLFPASCDVFRQYVVRYADVEICSHCNARCRFCPVSDDPLPRQSMSDELFEVIAAQLAGIATLKWVSLNHYNEPLLDRTFDTKAAVLARYGLRLRLYTNASMLLPARSQALAQLGIVESLVINIPSSDPEEYQALMGVRMPRKLLDNIRAARDAGLQVHLCVNGSPAQAGRNKQLIEDLIVVGSNDGIDAFVNLTHDRAGLLDSKGTFSLGYWDGVLAGCRRMFEHLHVNVKGDVFLCCQDYYQHHRFGNLGEQSIDEVMTSPEAISLRRQVFGGVLAPDSFICRSCVELIRDPARSSEEVV